MRNTLTPQPLYNSYIDIIKCFKDGIPLSCDQLHRLYSNHAKLSNEIYDPIMRYYDISQHKQTEHKPSRNEPTFLLHSNIIDAISIQQLKYRLEVFIKDQPKGVTIPFTCQQFKQLLTAISTDKFIFWHGNQALTEPPHDYQNKTGYIDYFQWDKLFGVIKYKKTGNILVYFEDRMHRPLAQCIEDYWHKLNLSLAMFNHVTYFKPPLPQSIMKNSPPEPNLLPLFSAKRPHLHLF